MGPYINDEGSTGHSSTGAFHFSIPTILSSIQAAAPLVPPRLDRDSGIAYLAQTHAAGL